MSIPIPKTFWAVLPLLCLSCNVAGRQDVAAVRGDISALRNETQAGHADIQQGLVNVGGDVAAVKTVVEAEVNIGGDGDSIVSWIMAVGLIAAALAYPCVIRPIRRWRQGRWLHHGPE